MSNPVSLYVADEATLLKELSHQEVLDGEKTPNLRDYLENVDSDFHMSDLSELFEDKAESLADQPSSLIMNTILWSNLDQAFRICDIDSLKAEILGLELAISPATIRSMKSAINAFDPAEIASAIFDVNEYWQSEDELADYLSLWSDAFTDALEEGKGLYYKIWV